MAEQNQLAQATFATLCQMLTNEEWKFKKDEEKLTIECGAQGEDLPIQITIEVDAKREIVFLFSPLPCVTPEDKRLDMAIAISAVNNSMADGCFDYDVATGRTFFRLTNSFKDSTLGEGLFKHMLMLACHVVDHYNDKFLMLSKGMIEMEKFLAEEMN